VFSGTTATGSTGATASSGSQLAQASREEHGFAVRLAVVGERYPAADAAYFFGAAAGHGHATGAAAGRAHAAQPEPPLAVTLLSPDGNDPEPGQPALAHKAVLPGGGCIYPDVIVNPGVGETVAVPADRNEANTEDNAAGAAVTDASLELLGTAAHLFAPHQLLGIVMPDGQANAAQAADDPAGAARWKALRTLLEESAALQGTARSQLSSEEHAALRQVAENLGLSRTQETILREEAFAYRVRHGAFAWELCRQVEPRQKEERNERFAELRNALRA
jgi:hypothetical protein